MPHAEHNASRNALKHLRVTDPTKASIKRETVSHTSWAGTMQGVFFGSARSVSCTWPGMRPGNASSELLELGHSAHSLCLTHTKT